MPEITKAEHVTEAVLDEVWSIVEGWYLNSPIDWEDVYARIEKYNDDIDFGTEIDTPAMRKIQRIVRQWKREATN
jgi:hypothetical protein